MTEDLFLFRHVLQIVFRHYVAGMKDRSPQYCPVVQVGQMGKSAGLVMPQEDGVLP